MKRTLFTSLLLFAFAAFCTPSARAAGEDDFCGTLKLQMALANASQSGLAQNQGEENFTGPYRKNYKPDLHMYYDSKVVMPGAVQSVNSIWKGATTFEAIMYAVGTEVEAKELHQALQAKVEACFVAMGAEAKKYRNGANNIFYEVANASISVRYSSLGGNGKQLVYMEIANIASVNTNYRTSRF